VTSAYFIPGHKTMHMTSCQQQHNNIKKLTFEYLEIQNWTALILNLKVDKNMDVDRYLECDTNPVLPISMYQHVM
jgi:hypothetical protein